MAIIVGSTTIANNSNNIAWTLISNFPIAMVRSVQFVDKGIGAGNTLINAVYTSANGTLQIWTQ